MNKEIELVKRMSSGDEQALVEIIGIYHSYVTKIVYSILSGYTDLIDWQGVVNQVFFTLWENAKSFDTSKSTDLKGYIGVIAKNSAINEKKKYVLVSPIIDDVLGEVSDSFSQIELKLILEEAIRKLDKQEQLILVKFYFQGNKINTISEDLGLSESTVKSKLRRSKEKLKKYLLEGGYVYED